MTGCLQPGPFSWLHKDGERAMVTGSGHLKADAPTAAMPQVRTIAHFIAAPGGGGAEAMLRNLVATMNTASWRNVVIVMNGQPWPREMAELRAHASEVHDLEATALLKKDTLVRLIRLLRELKPEVLQTWMHHADFVGGWCGRLAGVRKIVWSFHCRELHTNPGDSELKTRVFGGLLRLSSRVIPSRIISCSAAAIEDHVKMGYPRSRMTWVPNGILTDRFVPDVQARQALRDELHIPQAAPLVGYVGRFHEMKDLSTWLRAAGLLQKRRPETHFWLCGGQEHELAECARAALSVMPHRDQVHFTSFRADAQKVYPALDVFSLSSRTEACPMTLMEALSCGVPCVATDVGDCALLVESAACVVPPHNPEALAQAWSQVLEAPCAADQLRAAAVRRFDIRAAALAYEKVYQEVLSA